MENQLCPMSFNRENQPLMECMGKECAWWSIANHMCSTRLTALNVASFNERNRKCNVESESM